MELDAKAMEIVRHQGDLDSAASLLVEAIAIDSMNYLHHLNLSTVRIRQRRFDEAIESSIAVLRHKVYPEAVLLLGMLYELERDTIHSNKYFQMALNQFSMVLAERDSCDTRVNRAFAALWNRNHSIANSDIQLLKEWKCDTTLVNQLVNFDRHQALQSLFVGDQTP